MRVMVIVKATKDSEAGAPPDAKMLEAMGKFNEELVKAGIMLSGDGLHPSVKAKRIEFSDGKTTVIDGPFALRGCILNYRTTERNIEILLEDLRRLSGQILAIA